MSKHFRAILALTALFVIAACSGHTSLPTTPGAPPNGETTPRSLEHHVRGIGNTALVEPGPDFDGREPVRSRAPGASAPIADEALQTGKAYPLREQWHYSGLDPSCEGLIWSYANAIPGVTVSVNPTRTGLSDKTAVGFSKIPPGTAVGPYTQSIQGRCTGPNPHGVQPRATPYTIAAVTLDIARVGQKTDKVTKVTDTTFTPIVGQFIELKPTPKPDVTLDQQKWIIPGDTVKTYTQSKTTATLTNLAAADLTQAKVHFYWIHDSGGAGQDVTLDGTFPTNFPPSSYWGRAKSKATANVLGITGISMTSKTGIVEVSKEPSLGCFPALHFGHLSRAGSPCDYGTTTPGIDWKFKGTAPAGGAGDLDGTQLINRTDSRTGFPPPAPTPPPPFPGTAGFALDACIHYGKKGDTHQPISAGAAATWESNDSPGLGMYSTWKTFTAADQFVIHFVYKPSDDAGASADRRNIWVQLGHLNWSWSGTATNAGTPTAPIDELLPLPLSRNPSWLNVSTPSVQIPAAAHPNWRLTASAHATDPRGMAAKEPLPTWGSLYRPSVQPCPPGG